MAAVVQFEDGQCTVSLHEHIVVIDLRDSMRAEHVDVVDELVERLGGERPGSVGIFVRVAAGAGFPTVEARQAFIAFLREHRTQVRAIHVVLDGRGFWAATMSALAATMSRAVPLGPGIRIHASVEEAATAMVADFAADRDVDRLSLTTALRRAS